MFGGIAPKFAKHYANVGEVMKEAFSAYAAEVKSKAFPVTGEHTFKIADDVMDAVERYNNEQKKIRKIS